MILAEILIGFILGVALFVMFLFGLIISLTYNLPAYEKYMEDNDEY